MKRVLCYGDSNTFGMAPLRHADDLRRYGPDERWPSLMQAALGSGWSVIAEGQPGRTTVHDDPIEGTHKNGRSYLRPCLESHWPLDVFILMLGVNDLKARFALNPGDVAYGVGSLLADVRAIVPAWTVSPRLLLVCSPPIECVGWLASMYEGGDRKSRLLPELFRVQAERYGASFFDAGTVARMSPIDGIHIEPDGHRAIAAAMAAAVSELVK